MLETVSQRLQTTLHWTEILTWVLSDKQASVLNLNVRLGITAGLCRMARSRIGVELPPAGQGLSMSQGLQASSYSPLCVPLCCINGMSVFKTVKPVPSLLNSFEEEVVNCQHKSRRMGISTRGKLFLILS